MIPEELVDNRGSSLNRSSRSDYRRDTARSTGTFAGRDRIVEAAQIPRTPVEADPSPIRLVIGDDVNHPKFGLGVVTDVKQTPRRRRDHRQLHHRRPQSPPRLLRPPRKSLSFPMLPSLFGAKEGGSASATGWYGGTVELSRTQWGSVSSFAIRIAHFAGCVSEAHRLGHGPGEFRKPWGIGFQRHACSIYALTLGPEYLRGIADASGYCAGLMDGAVPDDGITADWEVVAEFLRSTSEALQQMPEVAEILTRAGAVEIGSTSPPVLRYELFAELLNSQGVARLEEAAGAVARCCESHVQVMPTAQELEWLLSVAAQEPIGRLAERNETSIRGMYRRIEKMWERLGVANQVQGIALAVQEGWITAPLGGSEAERTSGSKS